MGSQAVLASNRSVTSGERGMGPQAELGSSRSATSGERGMGPQAVLGAGRSVNSSSVVNTPTYGPIHVPAAIRSPAATQGVVTRGG